MVIATTGPAISRAPTSAAWTGVSPSSMWRCTFSTTTIASSTTSPIASTMASRVSRLRLKPSASISMQPPMIDSGMVTTGIRTERSEPRNRKMTTITIATASISVRVTSLIEDWMNRVES